ncbi:hypothetical protein HPB50_002769 [Hyalomma asiaticum]|uniref:Uncharacterized protein n=2 Tax=Hyalomma asiaticum TaxID=266040 RepID=A0ACB7S691_HYAAI|nr:hypothetical protein HPB50_002769 [Hyalomma asiaticum]
MLLRCRQLQAVQPPAPACSRSSIEPPTSGHFPQRFSTIRTTQSTTTTNIGPIVQGGSFSTRISLPDCACRDANPNEEPAVLAPTNAGATRRRDAGATGHSPLSTLHLILARQNLLPVIIAFLTMDVVEVEGTEITPEDATLQAGWISSHRNKQRRHASNAPTSSTPQNSISGIAISNVSQRPASKPRQPRLPDNHVKVVIRPRDGLNLSKMGEA